MSTCRTRVEHTTVKVINPDTLAPPRGFSHGVALPSGTLVCIAGQIGWNRDGQMVSDRFADQFDQALANVLAVVAEAGGGPEHIGHLTIYVTDKTEYVAQRAEVGTAYRRQMGSHYPAMSLIEVKSLLDPRAKVEIEGIAVVRP